jgi:electron transfer flavoprotein beta subunit
LKVAVCIKSTPDTDTRIQVTAGGAGIDESGIKWIMSPYDGFALEEGVLAKEKHGGEVVLFSAAATDVSKVVRDALALGADRAVVVEDALLKGADSLGVATALAKAIAAEGSEIVFCGKQAIDDDNVQVPAMIAEVLGWPHVSFVKAFAVEGGGFTATRNVGGGVEETVKGSLPVVITAERGLNTPRYAKLPEIMKAKTKPLAKKTAAGLGLSADDLAPAVTLSGFGTPPARAKGKVLTGDPAAVAKELVQLLRDEAKVL